VEEELKKSLREKDILLDEMNHRIKNNLATIISLINLKESTLNNTVDLSSLKRQVEAIRIVHEKLSQNSGISEINVRDYIEDLLSTVFSSFSVFRVTLNRNIQDVILPTSLVIPLGLIVNEIATNALIHGFTPEDEARFTIDFTEDELGTGYILTLSNTGNPFPEEIDLENPETLGLRLISALTEQINGTVELTKRPYPRFTIRFPGPHSESS
jgi:two-component sensor histidine kinase